MPSHTSLDDQHAIVLSDRADFSQAEELKGAFETVVASTGDVDVDAQNVEFISTPCLQIIIAAATSIQRTGRKFQISNASPAFHDAVNELGLDGLFSQWERE